MSSSNIKTRQQAMLETVEGAVNMVLWPGGSEKFQRLLMEAEQQQTATIDDLARLISLTNAALVVSNNAGGDPFAPWYGDMVGRLLRHAMEAIDVIEARMEAHREYELGRKPS